MKIKLKTKFVLPLLLMLFFSCNSNYFYNESKNNELGEWKVGEIKQFEVEISDSLQIYNIYIKTSNTNNYAYQNLWLFIQTTSPAGNKIRDTFEIELADERGKWYGSGLFESKTMLNMFKPRVRFSQCGSYTFEIEQAMRTQQLKGIESIGVCIEETKNRMQ